VAKEVYPAGGGFGAAAPSKPSRSQLRKTDSVNIISKVLLDLPFSQISH
jgi:hypothetical protein